jgi:hypothetical protein
MGRGEDPLRHFPDSCGVVFPGAWVQKAIFLGVAGDCLSQEAALSTEDGNQPDSAIHQKKAGGERQSLDGQGLSPRSYRQPHVEEFFHAQLRQDS